MGLCFGFLEAFHEADEAEMAQMLLCHCLLASHTPRAAHKALAQPVLLWWGLLAGTQPVPLKAAVPHRAWVFSVNGSRKGKLKMFIPLKKNGGIQKNVFV